jgi:hypothetical protein
MLYTVLLPAPEAQGDDAGQPPPDRTRTTGKERS